MGCLASHRDLLPSSLSPERTADQCSGYLYGILEFPIPPQSAILVRKSNWRLNTIEVKEKKIERDMLVGKICESLATPFEQVTLQSKKGGKVVLLGVVKDQRAYHWFDES